MGSEVRFVRAVNADRKVEFWEEPNPPEDYLDLEDREIKQLAADILTQSSLLVMHAVANKESMTRTQLRMMKHMSLVQLEPPLVGPASNRPVPTSSPKRPLEPPDVVHFAVKSALAEEDMVMDEKEA